jgi:hypothetical protein
MYNSFAKENVFDRPASRDGDFSLVLLDNAR